jgi:GNAT superfamily N-acetyltransferase
MADLEHARALFQEYGAQIGIELYFPNFRDEIAALPGGYTPPGGRLHVRYEEGRPAGCVALRPLSATVCELKRLYVRPEFRGSGLGRKLVELMTAEARAIGYSAMRLDTLPAMRGAIALYRELGFHEIPAYGVNPAPGSLFFELNLAAAYSGSQAADATWSAVL